MTDIPTNTIHCGDNLEIMRNMPDESVDLIYLDPPFFSGRNYDVIWEGVNGNDHSEVRSFKDTEWYRVECPKCAREVIKADRFCSACGASLEHATVKSKNDIYAYIDWMIPRLKEMHRILKPTGAIYLHVDYHAVHYLKIEMDRIFGMNNFRNEIVWCYTGPSNTKKWFPRKHDTILFYTKGTDWTFNIDNIKIPYKAINSQKGNSIIWGKNGMTDDDIKSQLNKGKIPEDWWDNMSPVGRLKNERLGYPTQKPEALLERIIKASSNVGNIVFDPFAGCATTMAVAQRLGRKWIGIDVSPTACAVITKRLHISVWQIEGMPMTTEELAKMEHYEFQQWVCTRMQAKNTSPDPTRHGGADGGIDGIVKSTLDTTGYAGALIQVKQSRNVGVDTIDKHYAVMTKPNNPHKNKMGFIVALSFGKGAVEQVTAYNNEGKVEIILVNAEDIAEKGYF